MRQLEIPRSPWKRLFFFRVLPAADICIVAQALLSSGELGLLKRRYATVVFDFDRAVWSVPEGTKKSLEGKQHAHKYSEQFARQCRQVDKCIAGNIHLARKAGEYCENVSVVPTGIDTGKYVPRQKEDATRPVQIGWIGPSEKMGDVRSIFEQLTALAGPVQFLVVSDRPYQGPCQEYVFWEKWGAERELQQLHGMDVGVMPLVESEYSLGECRTELLKCMACAVPTVASSVGMGSEVIDHGIDGFLVDEHSEWDKYVLRLIDDPELRLKIGAAAREKIRSRFELDRVADMLWNVLEI